MSLALHDDARGALSGGAYLHYVAPGRRLGNRLSGFPQCLDVQLDGITNELKDLAASLAGCDTSRKIWNVCAVTGPALFDHNEIFHNSSLSHFLRPALFVECTRRDVCAKFSRDRDGSWPFGVLELPMAALGADVVPAGVLQ